VDPVLIIHPELEYRTDDVFQALRAWDGLIIVMETWRHRHVVSSKICRSSLVSASH
jgi:hypothetical protein